MMKVEAFDFEIKDALEVYRVSNNAEAECFQTISEICPHRVAAIQALVESYGEWKHISLKTIEYLQSRGFSKRDIQYFSIKLFESAAKGGAA